MQEEDILKNDNAAEPIEQPKPAVDVPENASDKKGKLTDAAAPLTKVEGMIMFVVVLAITLVCSFGINYTNNKNSDELLTYVEDLEFRMSVLENKIDTLETSLVEITEDLNEAIDNLNKKPINIIINGDGQVVNPKPDDGFDAEDPTQDPNFDARPFLGVAFPEDINSAQTQLGLKVNFVYQYSPAEFAGIKAGDIISSIDGQKVMTFEDLDAIISQRQAGDVLIIDLITVGESGIEYKTIEAVLTYRGNFDLD
jgi:membrane-associated protease RseP (regulator of RpoE activity)